VLVPHHFYFIRQSGSTYILTTKPGNDDVLAKYTSPYRL
jgi:hypothetical protein